MNCLNRYYGTNYSLVDVYCGDAAEYIRQSKLPYAASHSISTREVYTDGYIESYNFTQLGISKQYCDMTLDLEIKTMTFQSNHNQLVPFSQFLLDLLKIILSMQVIPVITILAVVSFVSTGTATCGLVAGALYGAVVLAKPCYHRFFGGSSQSRIMHQQRDLFPPVDMDELFKNHFAGEQSSIQSIQMA